VPWRVRKPSIDRSFGLPGTHTVIAIAFRFGDASQGSLKWEKALGDASRLRLHEGLRFNSPI